MQTTTVNSFPHRLALAMVRLYRGAANLKLRTFRFLLYGKTPATAKKILLFRTGSLGDSICAFPAIAEIRRRYPDAELHILTNAGAASLVSLQTLLQASQYNAVIDYFGQPIGELAKTLKQNRYDLVVELPQYDSSFFRLARNMIFFRLKTGIRKGFGWQLDNVPFFKKIQNRYIVFADERTRLLAIVNRHTKGEKSEPVFPLAIRNEDEAIVAGWLQQQNINKAQPLLAVVPGAKRHTNTWPAENFAEVLKHFAARFPVVLCGGKNEYALAEQLKAGYTNVWNACGVFTPVQTAVFFGKCALIITNDTGPLHLAYAAGTPSVSLFSNRDYGYRWFPPMNEKNKVLRAKNIDCAPCFLESCPFDNKCLRAIPPADVIRLAEEILGNKHQ